MQTNQIEKIRKEIKKYFNPNHKIGEEEIEFSPSRKYYFTAQNYRQNDPARNWVVTQIRIWKEGSLNYDFEYFTSSDIYPFAWVVKEEKEYLFLPEVEGGQSVYDTENRKLYSFYDEKDPFIWISLHPFLNTDKMAVEGAYWACPSEFRIYNISKINQLPYHWTPANPNSLTDL